MILKIEARYVAPRVNRKTVGFGPIKNENNRGQKNEK